MAYSPFFTPAAPVVRVNAAQEVVPNLLVTLWAMSADDDVQTEAWLAQRAAELSPEQRRFNRLIFGAFGAALLPTTPVADFPAYLVALEAEPAAQFQRRLAAALECIEAPALYAEAQSLLAAPLPLQRRLVDHLRQLWETHLAAEWQRHANLLVKMTETLNELIFSQPQWQAANAWAALRFLLQTEPDDRQLAQLAGVRQITLILSPYVGAHLARVDDGATLWVVRRFDPQLLRRDSLRRVEALAPLNALNDDTRLRILELLVAHGEMRAQEIIAQLEASQGNVSRHLRQLGGVGFVRERRAGDANKLYTYDAAGLRRLMFLLRQLLSSHNVRAAGAEAVAEMQLSQARAGAPAVLHPLLDDQGRITRWSSKAKEQDALLHYLLEKFEPEQRYSEQEVNGLLKAWYLDADYVLVRRSLVDLGLLRRTKDGARYWRE